MMVTEKIVVSDTNIFIDLVKLDLLGDFFSLPWDIHTTDFSVCHYAQKHSYTLLTGDMNLRKVAVKENISVHGILFLFDELVRHGILPPELAADTLKKLKGINTRLPLDEVDSRIKKWETTNKNTDMM